MRDRDSRNVSNQEEIIRLKTQMDIVDETLGQVKLSFSDRVNEVKSDLKEDIMEAKNDFKADIRELKEDLHNRINRLEGRLQWSIGIAVAVIAIIVPVLVKFLST